MMINAYKNFFKGYVDFAGRSTRSDYWWIWLGNMIIYIPFFFAYGNAISNPRNESALIALGGTAIIYMVIGLALLLPGLALTVRRLRDAGFHWALIFIVFIPLGSIVLLVLLAMPTKEEATPAISEAQEVRVEEVIEASPFEETDNK
ncbi:DUF805 domain-containing protein [Streptococcus sp. Marseille-Q3533]|uniref:DUF805 domain-containing protein n=2 Tax=Streptococcus TaxID=1301 RepID=UPI0032EA8C1D